MGRVLYYEFGREVIVRFVLVFFGILDLILKIGFFKGSYGAFLSVGVVG